MHFGQGLYRISFKRSIFYILSPNLGTNKDKTVFIQVKIIQL